MKTSRKYTLMWLFESVICLFLVVGVVKFMAENIGQDNKVLLHLNKTVSIIGQIKESILEAESSQRGYLITKNKNYLDEYHSIIKTIPEKTKKLDMLIDGDTQQRGYYNQVISAGQNKVKEMDYVLYLFETDPQKAKESVQTDRGKKLMDVIKYNLDKMREREIYILDNYKQNTYKRLKFMCWMFPTVMIANLSLLILSYYTIKEQEGLK